MDTGYWLYTNKYTRIILKKVLVSLQQCGLYPMKWIFGSFITSEPNELSSLLIV